MLDALHTQTEQKLPAFSRQPSADSHKPRFVPITLFTVQTALPKDTRSRRQGTEDLKYPLSTGFRIVTLNRLPPHRRLALSLLGRAKKLSLVTTSRVARDVVEVNGIEPSTSCLQSRRSPN